MRGMASTDLPAKVLAAVSTQLRSKVPITPTSLGKKYNTDPLPP